MKRRLKTEKIAEHEIPARFLTHKTKHLFYINEQTTLKLTSDYSSVSNF